MFDFDRFVNRPCIGERSDSGELKEGIFGRKALFIPDNSEISPFEIIVDFHQAYEEVKIKILEVPLTSTEIAAFIRLKNLPKHYPKIWQGDHLKVDDVTYDIINVEYHLPGSQKVILHEQC